MKTSPLMTAGTRLAITLSILCMLQGLIPSSAQQLLSKDDSAKHKKEEPKAKDADKSDKKDAKDSKDKDKTPDKSKDKDAKDSKDAKDKDGKANEKAEAPKPELVIENVVALPNAEELVNKPHDFLGKNIKFTANFFAFSNLALDYKPAYRSAKTHLSFLVLRQKSHIPLSELKLAMMVPKEKDPETQLLATLKDGEAIEITGKVFATALDEPWVEVLKLKKLKEDKDEKKPVAKAQADSKDSKDSKDDAKADKGAKSDSAEPPAQPKVK